MPQGLQCFSATGVLELDITETLTRTLGSVYTGTSNGSYVDPELAYGRPYYFLTGEIGTMADFYCPDVTISGTTISWSFPFTNKNPATITYGLM